MATVVLQATVAETKLPGLLEDITYLYICAPVQHIEIHLFELTIVVRQRANQIS